MVRTVPSFEFQMKLDCVALDGSFRACTSIGTLQDILVILLADTISEGVVLEAAIWKQHQ